MVAFHQLGFRLKTVQVRTGSYQSWQDWMMFAESCDDYRVDASDAFNAKGPVISSDPVTW